jgi:beta-lactam-binding protein with PASTA domain
MGSIKDKIQNIPIWVHLLTILVLTCIVVFIVLGYLDVYTNHNKAVRVPDVKGLQLEDAIPFFEENLLRYTVIDSIYSKDVAPGAIVDLMPEINSYVKKNRIVYITVNAKTEEKAPLPDVADMSIRQANALLRAHGFIDVEWKYISGPYRDLTIGVEYGGGLINAGERVPLTGKLILVVSDGEESAGIHDEPEIPEGEVEEIIEGDESWF